MAEDGVPQFGLDGAGETGPDARDGRPEPSRRREFEETALPHLDALYNMALKMVREPADAEDLVQETFVRAYRFFSRYERGTNCKAWLFTILRNVFINRYRKVRSQPDEIDFGAIEEHSERIIADVTAAPARDPETAAANAILGERVQAALEALPADYRMVVVLSIVEGYTYKEIAAIMSCPIGTVMSRLFRARQILQSALEPQARERGLLPRDDGTVEKAKAPTGGREANRFAR
ncbi:MAG: sigma-70 family RNA polymerase sigma factor [Acidobacteriota bacterium]